MSELRTYQPSFTAGELSPALAARVDLAKFATGLRTASNLFIHPHGGVSNRAGLQFINEVKDSADYARLVSFQFNTEQSYILEFGDKYLRVYRDGGLVLSGMSPYEVVTPYDHTDVADLVYIQEADVMYICHPDYPVQKLGRLADDNWTLTAVTFAPKTVTPTGFSASAFHSTSLAGTFGTMTVKVTSVAAGGAESNVSAGVSLVVRDTETGEKNRISWTPVSGAAFYRVYRTDTITGILVETANSEVELLVTSRVGDGTTVPSSSAPGAPAVPTGVTGSRVYGNEIKYKVSAVNGGTGEESLPTAEVTVRNDMRFAGNKNILTWSAVAGASGYIVYRSDNGVFGYIGRSETTSFTDENIVPDLSDTPQSARNPFNAAGDYPRCATFIEQRLGFFSTKNDPQAAWLSQSANYENFGVSSPAKPNDAVTFRIKARQVNEIRSAIALKGLMLLSSGAEWIVSGGSNSDAISPSAIKIDAQGYRGASKVQPIVVGNTVLFAQDRGGIVRDFSFEFTSDSFTGKDLTILARHLFEGREIKAWAYAQSPNSIAWVVMDDGSLISLTYLKEHEVWGWTRHESGAGAFFEDVTVVADEGEDIPYFIVRRTIDGETVRYIERLHTRTFDDVNDAFFVDCGLTYSGAPVTEISGLDHLEGAEVVALADGNVVRNLTVTAGKITLENAASKVHVGLPYEAALQTLNLDLGQVQGIGTVQGRMKSISEVTLRVERTRGIFVGPYDGPRTSEKLVEYRQRSTEAWNEAIRLYTGDVRITPQWDWNDQGSMWVKQFDPLPMTVLAIMPDVTIGR